MNYIFGKHDIQVARSSAEIAREVEKIPIEDTRPGDLLFFKGRDINSSRIGHVALVVENNGRGVFMMHASRQGIVLEEYKQPYYTRRFVHAGRLPALNHSVSDPIPDPEPDVQAEPSSPEETTGEVDPSQM